MRSAEGLKRCGVAALIALGDQPAHDPIDKQRVAGGGLEEFFHQRFGRRFADDQIEKFSELNRT